MKNTLLTLVLGWMLLSALSLLASDHVDGPVTINHPVADISDLYAFPSPDKPGRLVLILNSYPFVPEQGHFSDQLLYRFVVKPVTATGTGLATGFRTHSADYRFDCTFTTPHADNNHMINCSMPSGNSIKGTVNQTISSSNFGIRLFAGQRSDAFLFNSSWFDHVVFNQTIPPAEGSNDISRLNVLSIIIELDVKEVFKPEDGTLFAIAAEISHRYPQNNTTKIIDRVGRPEISNARMVASTGQDDLRDLYNQEQTFNISATNLALYEKRLAKNIDYYDNLDKHQDWSSAWRQVLAKLLVNDYLVIDTSKNFTPQGYFDIENSMLKGQAHTRSGGRVPGDHVINTLMTTMINGGHAQAISDGIATDTGIPSTRFPYLLSPDTGLLSLIKTYLARKNASSLSLKKRGENTP